MLSNRKVFSVTVHSNTWIIRSTLSHKTITYDHMSKRAMIDHDLINLINYLLNPTLHACACVQTIQIKIVMCLVRKAEKVSYVTMRIVQTRSQI